MSAVAGIARAAVGSAVSSVLGSKSGLTADQSRRVDEVQKNLDAALGGDVSAAKWILNVRFHAIQFSKNLAEKAWAKISSDRPDIAAAASEGYVASSDQSQDPSIRQRIGQELTALRKRIQADIANTANQVLSQTGPAAAGAIDPGHSYSALPFSSSQLVAGVAVVVAIALAWFFTRKR